MDLTQVYQSSLIFTPTPKTEDNKLSKDSNLSIKSFMKDQEERMNYNYLGFLKESYRLQYKNSGEYYSVKLVDKDTIVRHDHQNKLNAIYSINNESTLKLLAHIEEKDKICFIFEDVENISLLQRLLTRQLPEKTLLTYYRQILEAVKALHKQKLYGLITTPRTIIFDKNDQIRLTDIGFSKLFKERDECYPHLVESNGVKFNEFMSPNVLLSRMDLGKINYNEKTDIWQLGVLFYIMASKGQMPYEAVTDYDLYNKILKGNVTYAYLNDYSSFVLQFIAKMLKKDNQYGIDHLLSYDNFNQLKSKSNQILNSAFTFNQENNNTTGNNRQSLIIFPSNKTRRPTLGLTDGNIKKNLSMTVANSNHNALFTRLSNQILDLEKEKKKLHEQNLDYYYLLQVAFEIVKSTEAYTAEVKIKTNNQSKNQLETLNLSMNTKQMYDEVFTKRALSEFQYQSLITNLLFEIERIQIELHNEKNQKTNLEAKIATFEKEKNSLINEHKQKIKFYEAKIQLLENTIFPENFINEFNSNTSYYFNTLQYSLDSFRKTNEELLRKSKGIETGLTKDLIAFLNDKESKANKLIEEKKVFEQEIFKLIQQNNENHHNKINSQMRLTKIDQRKDSCDGKELIDSSRLKSLVEDRDSLRTTVDKNTQTMKAIEKQLKKKDDEIEALKIKIEYYEKLNKENESNQKVIK